MTAEVFPSESAVKRADEKNVITAEQKGHTEYRKTADGKVISRCFSTHKQKYDRLGEQVTANSNYNRRNDHEASADFADAFQSACIFCTVIVTDHRCNTHGKSKKKRIK